MIHIIAWLAAIIVVEAVVEIEVESEIFLKLRGILFTPPDGKSKSLLRLIKWYLNGLLSCGYCLSVWVSAIAALFIPTTIISCEAGSVLRNIVDYNIVFIIADYIIKIFVIHRASNILHELIHRWLERIPFVLAFRPSSDIVEIPETMVSPTIPGGHDERTTDSERVDNKRDGIAQASSELPGPELSGEENTDRGV